MFDSEKLLSTKSASKYASSSSSMVIGVLGCLSYYYDNIQQIPDCHVVAKEGWFVGWTGDFLKKKSERIISPFAFTDNFLFFGRMVRTLGHVVGDAIYELLSILLQFKLSNTSNGLKSLNSHGFLCSHLFKWSVAEYRERCVTADPRDLKNFSKVQLVNSLHSIELFGVVQTIHHLPPDRNRCW